MVITNKNVIPKNYDNPDKDVFLIIKLHDSDTKLFGKYEKESDEIVFMDFDGSTKRLKRYSSDIKYWRYFYQKDIISHIKENKYNKELDKFKYYMQLITENIKKYNNHYNIKEFTDIPLGRKIEIKDNNIMKDIFQYYYLEEKNSLEEECYGFIYYPFPDGTFLKVEYYD